MKIRVQLDYVGGHCRLSFGEFDEVLREPLPIVALVEGLLVAVNAFSRDHAILVGHWSDELTCMAWRRVASSSFRQIGTAADSIHLSVLPDPRLLSEAIERSWRLPRLLLCVADEVAQQRLGALTASQWKRLWEEELPAEILALDLPLTVLGFYHQQWLCAFVEKSRGPELLQILLTTFGSSMERVYEEF